MKKKEYSRPGSMRKIISKINKIDEQEVLMLKKRIDIATAVILFFIAIIVVRLWFLQIHQGTHYSTMSEKNRIRMQEIAAPRGNITDRNDRLIITNRPSFNVVWIREDAPNPDEVIKKLSRILHKDVSSILDRIRQAIDYPRYVPIRLAEDIDWKTLVHIENQSFELPGIRVEVLPAREYLFENMASHIIGYLGEISPRELEEKRFAHYESGDQIGKMGIEKLYENVLHGEKGKRYVEVDVHGFEQQELKVEEPLPGSDIQLTLDIDLQYAAEEAMQGKSGSVVVMEVNTGKLLALSSSPPLKLNEFIGGISTKAWQSMLNDPLHPLLNKSIQGQYPPGSTYKVVTALAALNEGAVDADTVFYCSGSYTFGNRTYNCWKRGGHGAVNLHKAIAQSCDVYFYQAGQKVGVDALALYAESLGLGSKTGIKLEHEKSGLVPTTDWKIRKRQEVWQEGETLSVAIGQGFNLATPLQICVMMAATANGGKVFLPQLVNAITDPDGKMIYQFSPKVSREVLSKKQYLDMIKEALVAAVNEKHGTGGRAKLKTVTVAGKTGTAQVVRLKKLQNTKDEDIPYKFRDHAWFMCYAPAEKPEIAIAVMVEHGGGGGSAAAPIAKKILLKYFDIQEDD